MYETISPSMNLPIPASSLTSGPQYALDVNACLTLIDQHNHTPGYGVPVPSAGLNINSNLTFQSNSATNLFSSQYISQSSSLSTSYQNAVYAAAGNLYFNNGSGTAVQITTGSNVNAGAGSITGLPSGTASVTYNAGVYTFQSATSTAANLDGGSIVLRNNAANSFGLTLQPPNSLAANLTLTLPLIPAATSFTTIDTSGNITGSIPTAGGIVTSNLSATTQQSLVPTGSILPFAGTSAPNGYLLCDGSSIAQSAQAALYAVIGVAYGGSGSNFNLPDLRGLFMRGVSGSSGRDPNATSRTALNSGGNTGNNVGSYQAAATAVNGLNLTDPGHHHVENTVNSAGGAGTNMGVQTTSSTTPVPTVINTGNSTTGITLSSTDSETRPINVYVNYIIKT